jgi:hypothetical protein
LRRLPQNNGVTKYGAMKKRDYSRTELPDVLKLLIFMSADLRLVVSSLPEKSFREVTFQQGNNDKLCAVDSPSAILTVFELQDTRGKQLTLPISFVPVEVSCADRCVQEVKCMDFVFRHDVQHCHLYFFPPTTCLAQPHCSYYMVK